MAELDDAASQVVPAHLSFLAIYNPQLGLTDETFKEQLVYYYSKEARARRRAGLTDAPEEELQREENERLKQIGLAQGMVNFARSFSDGKDADSVETEKSRIVMKELEKGWWVLASIVLTRLPRTSKPSTSSAPSTRNASPAEPMYDYSAKEVSPPQLLLAQLEKAHAIFCLHHGPSLDALFMKLSRERFCGTLEKFWNRFCGNWDVLLHGSPAVDIFGGIKLAAGGELGIGVGEEEWGSGEREVLEDFARRTDGLVDVIVSRYGEPSSEQQAGSKTSKKNHKSLRPEENLPWMGMGYLPTAADGMVFSGVGAISRSSLRDLASWMEWVYAYGEYAYGVKDNPTSDRKKKRRRPRNPHREPPRTTQSQEQSPRGKALGPETIPLGIPPPIVTAVERSLDKASYSAETHRGDSSDDNAYRSGLTDPDTWMKYLTLGYGSSWRGKRPEPSRTESQQTIGGNSSASADESALQHVDPEPEVDKVEQKINMQIALENAGHFIIGLKGDLDAETGDEQAPDQALEGIDGDWNGRILLRTVHVQVTDPEYKGKPEDAENIGEAENMDRPELQYKRLRVVVYVHRPFIYTFLFDPQTFSLTLSSFYRNLHTYFAPLHKPLTLSTSPTRVASRIAAVSGDSTTSTNKATSQFPIYDLLHDPLTLTTHTSLPNIPAIGTLASEGVALPSPGHTTEPNWTRLDALNVHAHILATVASTRHDATELERTAKTTRGWWVAWMRLPPSSDDPTTMPRFSVADAIDLDISAPQQQHQTHQSPDQQAPTTAQGQNSQLRTQGIHAHDQQQQQQQHPNSNPDDEPDDEPDDDRTPRASPAPRTPPPAPPATYKIRHLRQAFLVRRARDSGTTASAAHARAASTGSLAGGSGSIWRFAGLGSVLGGVSGGQSDDDGGRGRGGRGGFGLGLGIGEGLGVDARRYVEGLVGLSR